jgi:hypothetical protein
MIVGRKDLREVAASPQQVEASLRVFLADGSVVVFPDGARVGTREVTGIGLRYDLTRTFTGGQNQVALDSVIGMEAFDVRTDPGLTLLASVGITAVMIGGTVALYCATDPKCFGSCPTVYTYDEEGERLEAETFSFSISPLLESRDVDRLGVEAGPDGVVELEVRNEALETHFINHLELLEVRHAPEERVVTDPLNRPVVVGSLYDVGPVTDRDGRDVTGAVRARDGETFTASESRVASVGPDDHRDWLEMTLPPVAADSAALVLELRNSLLTTILFYEFMLGRQGAAALDWMARDVEQIGTAVELGDWFYSTMGLRLEVERDGRFHEVARLGSTGPIAWKEVAFLVPVSPERPTRIRVSSLADEWRIDHIAWSPRVSRPDVIEHAAVAVEPLVGGTSADELMRIAEPDEHYLVTTAGTAFTVRFETGPAPADTARTYLLGSQGYYSEWVRPTWIRSARNPEPFRPTPDLLPALMERWLEVKGPMEAAFHETKIPVR